MQNQFIDLYRNGIKTAADVSRASLENSIRLQEKQLEIARGLLEEQSRSADEMTRAGSVQEILTLQSRIASAQLGRWAELWSNMWQALAQNQAQGLRDVQSFATRSSEDVARAAANQVSRAAGSVAESADAANHDRKAQQRRSA
jgi:phasin protein